MTESAANARVLPGPEALRRPEMHDARTIRPPHAEAHGDHRALRRADERCTGGARLVRLWAGAADGDRRQHEGIGAAGAQRAPATRAVGGPIERGSALAGAESR